LETRQLLPDEAAHNQAIFFGLQYHYRMTRYQHVAIEISIFLGDIGTMLKLSVSGNQPIHLKIGQVFLSRLSKRSIIYNEQLLCSSAKFYEKNFGLLLFNN